MLHKYQPFLLLLLLTLWWINIGTLKGKWKCCVEVKSVVMISYYLQPLLLFSWTQNHVFVILAIINSHLIALLSDRKKKSIFESILPFQVKQQTNIY